MDTSETGLEKIIVDWLVSENGYEQETPQRRWDGTNKKLQNSTL